MKLHHFYKWFWNIFVKHFEIKYIFIWYFILKIIFVYLRFSHSFLYSFYHVLFVFIRSEILSDCCRIFYLTFDMQDFFERNWNYRISQYHELKFNNLIVLIKSFWKLLAIYSIRTFLHFLLLNILSQKF